MDFFLNNISHLTAEISVGDISNCDDSSFESYPERKNWKSRTPKEWSVLFRKPSEAFQGFFQQWLFFGIISSIFAKIPRDIASQFLHEYCGDGVLTYKSIPELAQNITQWVEQRRSDPVPAFSFIIKLNKMLRISITTRESNLGRLKETTLSDQMSLAKCLVQHFIPCPLGPEVIMSIHVVSEFLMSLISDVCYQATTHSLNSSPVAFQGLSSFETSLPWVCLDQGWCPSELPVLFGQFDTSSLLLLKDISPPKFAITSPAAAKGTSCKENSCSSAKCFSRRLCEFSYSTIHTASCSNCKHLKAAPEKVLLDRAHLKIGSFPVVKLVDEKDSRFDLELAPANLAPGYVAISHVWSDGLGNLQENALPHCQILRLSRLIREMHGGSLNATHFWIDTLCVPPDRSEQQEAQNIAIEKMREVYENAKAVLVLDSWLLSSTIGSRTDVEILVHMFASYWNRRLWTFQEGAFAKTLYFQFADGAYDIDKGVERLKSVHNLILDKTLKPGILAKHISLRGFRESSQKLPLNVGISCLFASIRYRQTSVETDEPLCLAALLQLPLKQILSIEKEKRMKMFWKMLSRVPVDFLFYEGRTIQERGLYWAPQTLLRSDSNINGFEQSTSVADMEFADLLAWAEPSERGLKAWLSGLVFKCTKISLQDYLYLVIEFGEVYRFTPSPDQRLRDIHQISSGQQHSSSSVELTYEYAAFILNGVEPNMSETQIPNQGIIVGVREISADAIYAEKVCNGYCETLEMESPEAEQVRRLIQANGSSTRPVCACAMWTSGKQCWVVD